MPSLNFTLFADKVADGRKFHTIRALRVRLFEVDDDLSFFVNMRKLTCRRIRPNTPCIGATRIHIDAVYGRVFLHANSIYYRAGQLGAEELRTLARNDGFEDLDSFFRFFLVKEGLFSGQLIEWKP